MQIITLREAHKYLEGKISTMEPARSSILELTNWAAEKNKRENEPLIAYFRDKKKNGQKRINIGYTIQELRDKKHKRNFLVIKLPGTILHSIQGLQLDAYLDQQVDPSLLHIVDRHPDMDNRRLVYGKKLSDAKTEDLKKLFVSALNITFGINWSIE